MRFPGRTAALALAGGAVLCACAGGPAVAAPVTPDIRLSVGQVTMPVISETRPGSTIRDQTCIFQAGKVSVIIQGLQRYRNERVQWTLAGRSTQSEEWVVLDRDYVRADNTLKGRRAGSGVRGFNNGVSSITRWPADNPKVRPLQIRRNAPYLRLSAGFSVLDGGRERVFMSNTWDFTRRQLTTSPFCTGR
jgi:hypothetical protein